MFRHILMPTDGTDHSERAIERGIELAKLCGSSVTGIHVTPDYDVTHAHETSIEAEPHLRLKEAAFARAATFLAFVQETAGAQGVPCDTVIAADDHPYDAIVNTANVRGCDLIVMTSRYRKGFLSRIMGSESTHVLHRASIPVLTFRALMSADHPDKTAPGVALHQR